MKAPTLCKTCGNAYDYEIGAEPDDICFKCLYELLRDDRLMAVDVAKGIEDDCADLHTRADEIKKKTRSKAIVEMLDDLKEQVTACETRLFDLETDAP